MLPSPSTTRLCGKSSMPAPKLLRSLPEESNSRTGASGLSAQELAPQRSATQMWPSRSRSTALVEPQERPSGSLKKFSMVRYGLGCELGAAPGWAKAAARVMTGNAVRNARRFTIGMTGPPCALFHSVAEMKGSWRGVYPRRTAQPDDHLPRDLPHRLRSHLMDTVFVTRRRAECQQIRVRAGFFQQISGATQD